MAKEITDPDLLKQLNTEVSDPAILRQLEGGDTIPRTVDPAWSAKYPSLYGAYGAAAETAGTVGKAAASFVPNIIGAAGSIAKGAIEQPVKTAQNIFLGAGALPVGFGEKLVQKYGGEVGSKFLDWFGRGALTNFWQPFENQLRQKYGSLEQFKKTVEERPAEVMMDVSTLLGVTGKAMQRMDVPPIQGRAAIAGRDLKSVTSQAYNALLPPTQKFPLTKGGEALMGAAQAISPLGVAKRVATAAGKFIPERTPRRMYESGAKWGTTLKPEQRRAISNTMLKEKIPLTSKGYDKLMSTVDDINDKIKSALAPYATKTIDASKVIERTSEARKKAQNTFDPMASMDAIDKITEQFMKNWGSPVGKKLTVARSQDIKKDIYKQLKSHYDSLEKGAIGKYTDPEIAAMKNIARGLKEEIEKVAPTVGPLNHRESALLKSEPYLRRSTGRIANYNILSLDDVLAGTAGAVVGGPVGAAVAGAAKHALGAPSVKSRAAIGLESLRKATPSGVKPGTAAASAYLYETGQIDDPLGIR